MTNFERNALFQLLGLLEEEISVNDSAFERYFDNPKDKKESALLACRELKTIVGLLR